MNDEFYVRNDIPLSSPPLCLAYVKAEIGQVVEEASNGAKVEYSSNFVAIGCLGGLIQIWDLDVLGEKILFVLLSKVLTLRCTWTGIFTPWSYTREYGDFARLKRRQTGQWWQ